jgi:hypothetical protein
MAYTNSKKQQTIYIISESPSEEPIAIFNDIRDAYTFSKERYYGIVRDASSSIQQYYLVEEDLIANTRTVIWRDKTKNIQNSLARYTLR